MMAFGGPPSLGPLEDRRKVGMVFWDVGSSAGPRMLGLRAAVLRDVTGIKN